MANGYIHVQVDGVLYLAHRLIWRIVHHVDPGPAQIDHDDRIRSNNRKRNLKLASRCEFDNMQNLSVRKDSTSGSTGVSWDRAKQKWRVYLNINGKPKHLGYATNIRAARRIRREAKAIHHEFKST